MNATEALLVLTENLHLVKDYMVKIYRKFPEVALIPSAKPNYKVPVVAQH